MTGSAKGSRSTPGRTDTRLTHSDLSDFMKVLGGLACTGDAGRWLVRGAMLFVVRHLGGRVGEGT